MNGLLFEPLSLHIKIEVQTLNQRRKKNTRMNGQKFESAQIHTKYECKCFQDHK